MKRAVIICGLLSLAVCLSLYFRKKDDSLGGKTFIREKGGFGGDFTITLREDGTYEYYEGPLSSYIGTGTWSIRDGILTMKEMGGYCFIFRFDVKDDELVFRLEDSSSFLYMTVEDGDRFVRND